MSFFSAQGLFNLLFDYIIKHDLDRTYYIRAIDFRIGSSSDSFLFLYFFLHSSLAVCRSLFGYYLLFFLEFTNDTLEWRRLFIWIYKKLSFKYFQMVFFDTNIWVLLSHNIKGWQYPLMNWDQFSAIAFLSHSLYILVYYAFYFPPSMSYLIWRFYPSWRWKVNSLLNFKPFSFP